MLRGENKNKEFGLWLREQRLSLGINQTEAGRRAGMSRTHWTRLELGESGTRRENIPKIAKAVKASLQETYRRAGYSSPEIEWALPEFLERFNALPQNVREDVAVIVEALWKKYAYQQKAASK